MANGSSLNLLRHALNIVSMLGYGAAAFGYYSGGPFRYVNSLFAFIVATVAYFGARWIEGRTGGPNVIREKGKHGGPTMSWKYR
ncbi:MAG: hypothetical protein M1151_07010 [Candidatus Thermoplasmatota archaeon]|jgi:hypothetical protein|nr:hypothetical protein [Candidatus Thermoplasmatota archaeon]MCL5786394.1 hypothetical protein [Candidatus Thermoplasmatota archaeon]